MGFILQETWNERSDLKELPNEGEGLHCPLPSVPDSDYLLTGHVSIVAKLLLHFANYFFPLISNKGTGSLPVELSGSLSPSQLASIHHVNNFIQTRSTFKNYLLWIQYMYFLSLSLSLSLSHSHTYIQVYEFSK